jgi:hypothetical protein
LPDASLDHARGAAKFQKLNDQPIAYFAATYEKRFTLTVVNHTVIAQQGHSFKPKRRRPGIAIAIQ